MAFHEEDDVLDEDLEDGDLEGLATEHLKGTSEESLIRDPFTHYLWAALEDGQDLTLWFPGRIIRGPFEVDGQGNVFLPNEEKGYTYVNWRAAYAYNINPKANKA